jgi:hypothetical protein
MMSAEGGRNEVSKRNDQEMQRLSSQINSLKPKVVHVIVNRCAKFASVHVALW